MKTLPQHHAIIFDVQRFSVHDGPGIRTTVFFKGCPLSCRWCQNPESLSPRPEIAFYADRCRNTGQCREVCPRDALRSNGDRVVREQCDACGDCTEACPHEALRLVGRSVSLGDLMDEVTRDQPFYEASGGGVTLSGGEATMQMDFMGAFAQRCNERGVSVGLQTCGLFRWEAFAPHLPLFAFTHFDLKLMDPDLHQQMTGGDNRRILENARRLTAARAPVVFRLPVVPGFTDGPSNLLQVAAFLRGLGVASIHLLRYHAMGEAKLARIGCPMPPLGLRDGPDASTSVSHAAELLRAEGLEVAT